MMKPIFGRLARRFILPMLVCAAAQSLGAAVGDVFAEAGGSTILQSPFGWDGGKDGSFYGTLPGGPPAAPAIVPVVVGPANGGAVIIDPGHGGIDEGTCSRIRKHHDDHCEALMESDLNLRIALRVKALLERNQMPVQLTRESDATVALVNRVAYSQKQGGALFVAIHADFYCASYDAYKNCVRADPKPSGISIYYYGKKPDGHSKPGGPAPGPGGAAPPVCDPNRPAKESKDLVPPSPEMAGRSRQLADYMERSFKKDNLRLEADPLHEDGALVVLRNCSMPSVLVEVGFLSNPAEVKLLKTSEYQDRIAAALFEGIQAFIRSELPTS